MENIIYFIALFLALIIALTIHEFFHAFTADRLGDPTARSQGRLTLNPRAHLDLIGTLMLFLIHFGWGKPVPIDSYNLKNPKRDEILISLSGPLSNLILAILLSIFIHFVPVSQTIFIFIFLLIQINVNLAVFNLIPIPPLDGSHILLNLLSEESSQAWREAFERYGSIILLIVLFLPFGGSNLLYLVMTPVTNFILNLLL